jgi:uncharacterized protein
MGKLEIDATTKRHYNYFVIYEWDERKRIGNLEKHGLDFADAWKVFEASVKVTLPVPHTESGEVRWMDVAEIAGVVLVLVYTMRGDSVRNISFRNAKRKERRIFDAALKDR